MCNTTYKTIPSSFCFFFRNEVMTSESGYDYCLLPLPRKDIIQLFLLFVRLSAELHKNH